MAVAAIAMAGSTAISAAGNLRQGYSNANIANYNAEVADSNAATVEAQGAEQARRSLVNSAKLIGAQSAAYGASGVTSDGSAMDVMRNSASQGELNALTLKNNAALKATAYKNEAALDRFRASNDRMSGFMNTASSSLMGASKTASASSGGGGGGGSDGGGGGGNIPTAGDE